MQAEWGEVAEKFVRYVFHLAAQCCDGSPEIDGVPKDNRGDSQVEPAGPMLLIFTCAVSDPAEAVKADRACERVV